METISDEVIFEPTEGKYFDTAEPGGNPPETRLSWVRTEGKFFDIAEPGMETARDEAILQPTEGKYFDSPTRC